ncbi:MAG: hypothetical protein LUI14_06755 [Lachnospiraceae bacterium]|nr:hypothetical protein [Lachnospiraceae bacterium]
MKTKTVVTGKDGGLTTWRHVGVVPSFLFTVQNSSARKRQAVACCSRRIASTAAKGVTYGYQ